MGITFAIFKDNFIQASLGIFEKSKEIIVAPGANTQMLWTLIPLLAGLIFLEIYFGHYKREELGWNSAVSNSLVLFFVGMSLFSYLSAEGGMAYLSFVGGFNIIGSGVMITKTAIAAFVALEGVLLFALNFAHALPKKFAFGISSGFFLNFLGLIAIILVYGSIEFNFYILPAVLLIFLCLVIILGLIEAIEPAQWHSK